MRSRQYVRQVVINRDRLALAEQFGWHIACSVLTRHTLYQRFGIFTRCPPGDLIARTEECGYVEREECDRPIVPDMVIIDSAEPWLRR